MLKSLLVKDYALIEEINVEFEKGLNIITGETGAGKSILIDAMGLLLGERASTEVIRKGAVKSLVEGVFNVVNNPKVKKILEDNDIDYFSDLILRREISLKGANRCFINDTPVQLNIVKEIGDLLVDLHGQHEHQSLLKTETHIDFLDEYGTPPGLINNFKKEFYKLIDLQAELNSLKEKEDSLKGKKDFYSYQIKEIDAVSPEEEEEEKLNAELKILENSEKLLELTNGIYQKLYESESSVYDSVVKIKNELEELLKIDYAFKEPAEECQNSIALINDISEFVRDYRLKIDIEPDHIEEVRERLGALNLLKKKYGGSLKAVIEYRKKIGEEFELADNYSEKISLMEKEISEARKVSGIAAEKLSKKRKESAKKIEKEVVDILKTLGFLDSGFSIKISQNPAGDNAEKFLLIGNNKMICDQSGIDSVEFFISTNPGENLKPLAKVASGGEISRIMLSLKTILAKNDKLPLLIFDEIDTGVSGRIAQKVGQALKSLASFHQIIAITHLPQIAGLADSHFLIEKSFNKDRVTSKIKKLTEVERVKEIAKLMSGEIVTDANLAGAKELMGLN